MKSIVQEHLLLGHAEHCTSPWFMPIFSIKKGSRKWRLLHDLQNINKPIQPMEPVNVGDLISI